MKKLVAAASVFGFLATAMVFDLPRIEPAHAADNVMAPARTLGVVKSYDPEKRVLIVVTEYRVPEGMDVSDFVEGDPVDVEYEEKDGESWVKSINPHNTR